MPPHSLPAATRESAFVHAIASAGVAFAVTRSCAEGTSTICGCDSHHKGPPGEGWKWGGCSEDADFGVLVSREFADARENRPDARSAMNKHNNEAGRTVSHPDPAPVFLPEVLVGPGLPALLFPLGQAWTPPHPTPTHSHSFCSPSFLLGLSRVFALPGVHQPRSVAAPGSTYQPAHSLCSCRALHVKPVGLALNPASTLFLWLFDRVSHLSSQPQFPHLLNVDNNPYLLWL